MTDPRRSTLSDPASDPRDERDECDQCDAAAVLAEEWTVEVEGTSYVPMGSDELSSYLTEIAELIIAAVRADPPRPAVGAEVAQRMVAAHFTGPPTIERTMMLFAERIPELLGERVRPAVHALVGSLAAGFAATLRDRTLEEQEAIRRAVLAARQQTEVALQVSEARFRAMFYEAAIGIALCDMAGRIVEANPALVEMFGYSADEFRYRPVTELVHPHDAPAVWPRHDRLVRGEIDNFRAELRFFHAGGDEIIVLLTMSLVRDDGGAPAYQVAMLEDITERHRLQSHLEYQAYHDPLTELPNRALFAARLDVLFAEPRHPELRIGLCYLDLDRFKAINDSLGHEVGDRMLEAVAARLAACATRGELVARMGGDEFVVLVEDSSGVEQLVDLAERVLAALTAPLEIDGQALPVSASLGIVERAVAGTDPSDLMRAADLTLYSAKADGRGRWAMHDPSRDEAELTRFALSAAMPVAVERGEFFVLYQPLVSLADQSLRGVEALVRWRHPTLGVLAPSRFISLAEETGAIVALGRWVLDRACRDARAWWDRFGERAPFVSVNVAPRQLHEPNLLAEIAAVLAEADLPAERLQVELTERALTSDEGAPIKALDGMRKMGVRIAIDDFGTGYSNLSYLRTLPVDVMKLDGSFGEGLRDAELSDPVDERIVGTLVSLGHALDLSVTAEGVETAAQAARLRALGCDEGQGWLFAPALEPDRISELLDAAADGSPTPWPGPG